MPALIAAAAVGAYLYLTHPTTLVVAVAPKGGSEPALLRAYADALAGSKAAIRLRLVPYGGVRESAEALRDGKADLAVVRPDVLMPRNALTLAVLREQATLVVAPLQSGIDGFPALAGKRLGILAPRKADHELVRNLVERHGLSLVDGVPGGPVPAGTVALVPVEEADLGRALSDGRIGAVILLTTPTSPAARRLVGIVRDADAGAAVTLFGASHVASTLARMPRLQAVTVPAGLFDGAPLLPAEDIPTVGASYRLMARATLSRSVAAEVTQHLFEMRAALAEATPAADDVTHPAYDTTVGATSARLPIHPGPSTITSASRRASSSAMRAGSTSSPSSAADSARSRPGSASGSGASGANASRWRPCACWRSARTPVAKRTGPSWRRWRVRSTTSPPAWPVMR